MKRTTVARINDSDGIEREMTHESVNSPSDDIKFITAIADDHPGVPVTFTMLSEYDEDDRRRREV